MAKRQLALFSARRRLFPGRGFRPALGDTDHRRPEHAIADRPAGLDHLGDRARGNRRAGPPENPLLKIGTELLPLGTALFPPSPAETPRGAARGRSAPPDPRADRGAGARSDPRRHMLERAREIV